MSPLAFFLHSSAGRESSGDQVQGQEASEALEPPGSRPGASHLWEGTGAEGEQTLPAAPLRAEPPRALQDMWPGAALPQRLRLSNTPAIQTAAVFIQPFLGPLGSSN